MSHGRTRSSTFGNALDRTMFTARHSTRRPWRSTTDRACRRNFRCNACDSEVGPTGRARHSAQPIPTSASRRREPATVALPESSPPVSTTVGHSGRSTRSLGDHRRRDQDPQPRSTLAGLAARPRRGPGRCSRSARRRPTRSRSYASDGRGISAHPGDAPAAMTIAACTRATRVTATPTPSSVKSCTDSRTAAVRRPGGGEQEVDADARPRLAPAEGRPGRRRTLARVLRARRPDRQDDSRRRATRRTCSSATRRSTPTDEDDRWPSSTAELGQQRRAAGPRRPTPQTRLPRRRGPADRRPGRSASSRRCSARVVVRAVDRPRPRPGAGRRVAALAERRPDPDHR